MTTQTFTELNAAQTSIYTRTNIRRAFAEFDETDVAGIYIRNDSCVVVYRDGAERLFPKQKVKDAFLQYTHRLKDFFSYLGPNYRGPSIWHNNAYIMFKGWHYSHALGHLTSNAKLQHHWADKFIHLSDPKKVITLLQSDQTDLGHLVAPDGLRSAAQSIDMESDLEENTSSIQASTIEPYCSCGSFQRQLLNVSLFQQEVQGFKPWCIHLTWFNKYRELLCKRTDVRNEARGQVSDKCVAWWYAPPGDATKVGRFLLLHTKSGPQAPLSHWRTYKPKEVFTQEHAWDLFFNMMEAGYIPFPGIALPQLSSANKK